MHHGIDVEPGFDCSRRQLFLYAADRLAIRTQVGSDPRGTRRHHQHTVPLLQRQSRLQFSGLRRRPKAKHHAARPGIERIAFPGRSRHRLSEGLDPHLLYDDPNLIDRGNGKADGNALVRVCAGHRLETLPGAPEALEVLRPARLRAGAAEAFTTEWLHAHHRANLVAIDIDVPGLHSLGDLTHPSVDAGMEREGQPVTSRVDRRDHLVELISAIGRNVQHGSEDLLPEITDTRYLQHGRRHKALAFRRGDLVQHGITSGKLGDMCAHAVRSSLVDQRSDIGRDVPRVADLQLVHRAVQHFEYARCSLFLKVQYSQCRAALAGGLKGRRHDVAHCLFRQRCRINDHGVETACFGDQWRSRREVIGHGSIDRLRGLERSGEANAVDAWVGDQRCADHRAGANDQLQHILGHACLVQQPHCEPCNQRSCFRGLRDHAVACHQCRSDLPREDREWKVPGRDTGEGTKWNARVFSIRSGFSLCGVVAEEIHRFAYL